MEVCAELLEKLVLAENIKRLKRILTEELIQTETIYNPSLLLLHQPQRRCRCRPHLSTYTADS